MPQAVEVGVEPVSVAMAEEVGLQPPLQLGLSSVDTVIGSGISIFP